MEYKENTFNIFVQAQQFKQWILMLQKYKTFIRKVVHSQELDL